MTSLIATPPAPREATERRALRRLESLAPRAAKRIGRAPQRDDRQWARVEHAMRVVETWLWSKPD